MDWFAGRDTREHSLSLIIACPSDTCEPDSAETTAVMGHRNDVTGKMY